MNECTKLYFYLLGLGVRRPDFMDRPWTCGACQVLFRKGFSDRCNGQTYAKFCEPAVTSRSVRSDFTVSNLHLHEFQVESEMTFSHVSIHRGPGCRI
jgi:hypothetical protein